MAFQGPSINGTAFPCSTAVPRGTRVPLTHFAQSPSLLHILHVPLWTPSSHHRALKGLSGPAPTCFHFQTLTRVAPRFPRLATNS